MQLNSNFKKKFLWPLSVSVEIALRKLRIKVDRTYRKIWIYLYVVIMLPFLGAALYKMHYDFSLIENYAHFERLNENIYSSWRKDWAPQP
jgi:hypothetical protein